MMKSLVITIDSVPQSVEAAQRCRDSAKKFGINSDFFWGFTPKDDPKTILLEKYKLPIANFYEKYSRIDNVIAAFLSHYRIWHTCIDWNEPILVFEHDAVVIDFIPNVNFDGLLSLGKPSYGKYNVAQQLGVNKLFSKPYLPGAHAYIIKPEGAKRLIEQAKFTAGPTDVFLNINDFPWLQEYYPWPVEAHDSFTTIQNSIGCIAKHNNNSNYKIL